MDAVLSKRIHEFVELGWEPQTMTETTATLTNRRPFEWWIFILAVFLLPVMGGVLYFIFWSATSRATVFLHQEDEELQVAGDQWLIKQQEAQRQVYIERQQDIKEKGFLKVMWPQLAASLLLFVMWIVLIKNFF